MNDTHQELRDLITDIVTGDGYQAENLDLTDEDWQALLVSHIKTGHGDADNFPVTMSFDNWMSMVRIARNNSGKE